MESVKILILCYPAPTRPSLIESDEEDELELLLFIKVFVSLCVAVADEAWSDMSPPRLMDESILPCELKSDVPKSLLAPPPDDEDISTDDDDESRPRPDVASMPLDDGMLGITSVCVPLENDDEADLSITPL